MTTACFDTKEHRRALLRNAHLDSASYAIALAQSSLNRAWAEHRHALPLAGERVAEAVQNIARLETMVADLKQMVQPSLKVVERAA